MSYSRVKTASFGPAKSGLSSVGYTLAGYARVTAGVAEVGTGTGIYSATVAIPDGFSGTILWDTGDSPVAYACAGINPGDDEFTDVKTSGVTAEIAADGLDAVLDAPDAVGAGSIRQALHYSASVAAGALVADPNADGTATTTTFKAFLDPDTPLFASVATPTGRTVGAP